MRWLISIVLLLCVQILTAQKVHVQRAGPAEGVRVNDIRSVLLDSRGIFWVGTYGDGLLYLKQGTFVNPVGANIHTGPYILDICENSAGEISVRSERGIAVYNGRGWGKSEAIDCFKDEINGPVLDTLQAGVGTVYEARTTGLFTRGLLDTAAQRIEDVNGLLNDTIQSLAFGADDALWIATRNNGLLKRTGEDIRCVSFPADKTWVVQSDDGTSVLGLRDGELFEWTADKGVLTHGRLSVGVRAWAIFDEQHLLINDDKGRLLFVSKDSPEDHRELVRSISPSNMAVDRFGTAWIIDESGNVSTVEALEGGPRWRRTYASVPDKDLIGLFPVADGRMVLVFADEIGELTGRRYTELTRVDQRITSAVIDEGETLWCGTGSGEILHFNKVGGLRALSQGTSRGKVTSRPVKFIRKVNTGLLIADDVWMYRIEFDDDNPNAFTGSKLFNLPAGTSEDCFYHMGSVYFVRGNEVCGIPIAAGFSRGVKPVLFLRDAMLPEGSIYYSEFSEDVSAFMSQSSGVSFSYGQNDLVFSWESISSQPGDVSYAYRLDEADDWHEVGNQTQIQLASLAPGNYMFNVRACDSRMNCNTLAEPFEFSVESPWWQRWWVWLLGGVILSATILYFVRRRERRIQVEANRQIELARARTRAVELEQKAMQLQMRPHFISNALNAIQSKVLNGKSAEASDELVKFSRMMRAMLDASRKERVDLEDEIELLQKYVAVVGLAKGITPTLEVAIEEEVETLDVEVPAMLLQPVIENCIEHGGPNIKMHISAEDRLLVVQIRDDGPGFTEGDIEKSTSVAMKLIRERLTSVGGAMKVSNADSGGAVVELRIPVE